MTYTDPKVVQDFLKPKLAEIERKYGAKQYVAKIKEYGLQKYLETWLRLVWKAIILQLRCMPY